MTKTFKLSAICFISALWFIAIRILANFVNFSDNVTSWLFSFLMQVIGMGLIPFLLYKQWVKGDFKADFHISKRIPALNYFVAVLIGLLLYYLTMGVSMIYQSFLISVGYTHITTSAGTIYSGWEVLVMEFITVAMLPAFFEEFYNRGLLLSVFEGEKSHRKIIIFLAIYFALFHQNIVQTGYTLIGGFIFAFMIVKTRNIWPGVIVHFINNGLSVAIDYSTQKGTYLGFVYESYRQFMYGNILIIFASWVAVAFFIVLLLRVMARINKKRLDDDEEQKRLADVSESIYKVFGPVRESAAPPAKTALWEYGPVIAAASMSLAVTVFTFIWGVLR
ncbi:MAG: type II CAAX endopeptidase family protein [Clostridia bacterium]|nr:type II CAAX endopeptidase family protein [Clostridia bacterium]